MTLTKISFSILGGMIAILAISWIVAGNQFFLYKTFAPAQEQVRRDVFEQTKSYNQGMIQELQNMQFEYLRTDSSHRDALASIILHRAADYDETKLPSDLQLFIHQLKAQQ